MEAILDTGMISLLNLTPRIIQYQKTGIVREIVDPSYWVKLLTMHDPTAVVKAGQWIRVCYGAYKGNIGFVTGVETWGVQVLVIPHLKIPTSQQAAALLKRKRIAIKPEPRLFDPDTSSSIFQHQAKSCGSGIYTSCRLVFNHGLLQLKLDFHSISPNLAGIPS